jgi:uncharacterized protein YceK
MKRPFRDLKTRTAEAALLVIVVLLLSGCADHSANLEQIMKQANAARMQQIVDDGARKRAQLEEGAEVMKTTYDKAAWCVRREALPIAATPESAEAVATVAVIKCGPEFATHSAVVRQWSALANDPAWGREYLAKAERGLRDLAIALIVKERRRALEALSGAANVTSPKAPDFSVDY